MNHSLYEVQVVA